MGMETGSGSGSGRGCSSRRRSRSMCAGNGSCPRSSCPASSHVVVIISNTGVRDETDFDRMKTNQTNPMENRIAHLHCCNIAESVEPSPSDETHALQQRSMQSWGLGNVPSVATGKFIEDTKVRHVSPVSTIQSGEDSDDGKITLKDKRFALEQEIVKLRKKFSQEEKLHETLNRALQRPVGSLPRIPPSLPAKIQKLLAEVAVLEEEVIRLEDHVGFLRREISDETSQLVSYVGVQKQRPVSDQHFSKPNTLSRIRIPKESSSREVVPRDSFSAREPAKSFTGPRKGSKASNEALHPQKPLGKDRSTSKASNLVLAVAHPPGSALSICEDGGSRRGAGSTKGALLPSLPPLRKPPGASDMLARLEGWQPQSKSGASGKNNPYKQFTSLNWGQPSHSGIQSRNSSGRSSPRNSPRGSFSSTSTLSVNWGDKLGNSSKSRTSATSSPRLSPRVGHPLLAPPSVGSLEKENLHSATSRLVSRPGTSRLGLSVDLSSSNVERKNKWGNKGRSAFPPPGKLGFSIINEAPQTGPGPNQVAEELVRCSVAIYSKLTKLTPTSGGKSSQNLKLHGNGSRGKHTSESLRDVYGLGKESAFVDSGPYRLAQEVTAIDYTKVDSVGAGSAAANWRKMRTLLEQLERATLDALSHYEKLAFWINIYNVCMMHAYLEHGIPNTPKKVVDLMRKAVVNVGGFVVDALTIEHICRLPTRQRNAKSTPWKNSQRGEAQQALAFLKNVGMEEILERSAFGLDRNEPMVTFALCCGTRSSPALRVYTPSGIESELLAARREYLQAAVAVSKKREIYLPELLECYMRDFAKDMEGLLDWLCQQLSGTLRVAVADCVTHPREGVLSHSINVMAYDYNFRYLFLIR